MVFFPNEVMPKDLKKTTGDIPGYPLVYNAADHNAHHREIIAIQKFLIGNNGTGGLRQAFQNVQNSIERLANGDYLYSLAGVFPSGGKIHVPEEILQTSATGLLTTSATTMTVGSTKDWPKTGILTKFNSNLAEETCLTDGSTSFPCSGGGNVKWLDYENQLTQMTNQELISYRVVSETQVLLVHRGLYGTTKQEIPADSTALVICGRAAVMFTPQVWEADTDDDVSQIVLDHTADLRAFVKVEGAATASVLTDVSGFVDVHYLLTVAANFEVIGTEGIRV